MDGVEKRKSERRPVDWKATISAKGRAPSLGAAVRDISCTGARLEGAELSAAPDHFDLTITHDDGETETRHARLVWRAEGAVGVDFGDYIGA